MKTSTTLVFLFLFVIVTAVYVFLVGNENREKAMKSLPVESMQLVPLEKDEQISRLKIENIAKKLSVTLELQNGKWVILEPVRYVADPLVVEGLATALRLSTKAKRMTREKDWAEYGLAKPSLKIEVGTTKNKRGRVLDIGDLSPVGNFVYARWEGEEECFLLNADLMRAFDQSLYGLRMKRIFRMPLKDVTRIVVQTAAGNYEIAKMENDWYWVEPVPILGEKISKRDLDYFFSKIERLFIKEFLDDKADSPSDLGFSGLTTRVTVKAGKKEQETLVLGSGFPERDSFYAMRADENTVFLVSKSILDDFFEGLNTMAQDYSNENGVPAAKPV